MPVIQELSDRLDDYPSRAHKRVEHRDRVSSLLDELKGQLD